MSSHLLSTRARASRPSLEGLESRELLSGARMSKLAPVIRQLSASPVQTASTDPGNGDSNPYGVTFVPRGFPRGGRLNPGDVLVSNYNASSNFQGTGTTIVRVTPDNKTSLFFQGPPGLDTGLAVLKRGLVLVGSVPSTDGTAATAGQGSLLVLDKSGKVLANFTDANLLNGPWDLTVNDRGGRVQVFVSNVLSGTVTRVDARVSARGDSFKILSVTQIASGFPHRGDPAAFLLGPTGLAYESRTDTLYVASTAENVIRAIPHAGRTRTDRGTGTVVYQDAAHLHGPTGLTFAPDGNLIAANGDGVNVDPAQPSELVEFTRRGAFVGQYSVDTNNGGAFGVAVSQGRRARLAAVNDVTGAVSVWDVRG